MKYIDLNEEQKQNLMTCCCCGLPLGYGLEGKNDCEVHTLVNSISIKNDVFGMCDKIGGDGEITYDEDYE